MKPLSVRDYRNNLAASFVRADNGEQVLIKRKNRIYALINLGAEDVVMAPELLQRINEARKEFEEGKTLHFESAADMQLWMDNL